jgi:divalent metal cation (Fe/Co/Zn/Cd) transporter
VYEGVEKIMHPEAIDGWHWVPIAVLVVALVLEGLSFRTAVAEANEIRNGVSWQAYIRHARAPELPVILLEDFAALIGLVLALFGVGLTLLTGHGVWDGLASLAIGVLLVLVAVVLAVETKSLLIGEGATGEQIGAIAAAIQDEAGLCRLIHMRTLHLGPEELLVAAKIAVPAEQSAQDVAAAVDRAEARIRAAVPIARVIYLETDIDRGA